MPITLNQKNGYITLRVTGTESIKLNTANGKQGANVPGELVRSMKILQAFWSVSGNAYFSVARGSNTVAYYTAGQSEHDYQNMQLEADSAQLTSNLQITFSTTGGGGDVGMLVLRLHKASGE
jgi:hypothetical protein